MLLDPRRAAKTQAAVGATLCGLALIVGACNREANVPNGVYDIRGAVVTVDSTQKTVELDHDEIPGVMAAMDMPYPVSDAKLLAGLKPGDSVRGKLTVASGTFTITSLQKR